MSVHQIQSSQSIEDSSIEGHEIIRSSTYTLTGDDKKNSLTLR